MMNEKQRAELDKIIAIAKEKDNQLNSMLFFNLIAAMPSGNRTEDAIGDMQNYLLSRGVEIVMDDVEMEEEENVMPMDDSVKPFNPSEIDIVMKSITLDSIVKRIENDEINIHTEFQRRPGLWSDVQKSQLIESLLLRIPLPAFYFDESDEDRWLVIDGLQRITTLKEFIVDKSLQLKGLEFFTDLNGCKFDDLPRAFVRRMEETVLVSFNVRAGTPENVKFNIFKRINTGGLELSAQEIRHAIFFGKSGHILKRLAELLEFKDTTAGSIKTARMLDHEFVLRYIAVCHYGIDKFETNSEDFLNVTMQYLNHISSAEENEITIRFKRTMKNAKEILGKHAFRKIGLDDMRRPINKAIFECWCYVLEKCFAEELEMLKTHRERVIALFRSLCTDDSFLSALKNSTKTSFNFRIKRVMNLIQEVLQND